MAAKKLKDWFDKELAIMLADKITKVNKDFNRRRFIREVDKETANLELKDRVELIADKLYTELGGNYKKGVKVLMGIMGEENENEIGMFTEYYWLMPVAKYVEKYGLDDFELSMKAIVEVTKRNTSEYAIRPYLEIERDKTLTKMKEWSKDENFHVRRLASEGLRPRLPWAKIEKWNGKNIGKERKWIIKHSLRKLVKNKDSWALEMIENVKR